MQQVLQHKTIQETWKTLPFEQQMANIGSEVERSMKWKEKQQTEFAQKAFFRALELFDLTLQNMSSLPARTEVARARELFGEYLYGDNKYQFTKEFWQKYFGAFTFLAQKRRLQSSANQ